MSEKEFNLNDRMYTLLREEPFYSSLSLHISKQPTDKLPTLAVGITQEGNFRLFYNKNYMKSLKPSVMTGALRHEFDHILYHHVFDRGPEKLVGKKYDDSMSKEEKELLKMWNIASDLAVNSHIPKYQLGEDWVVPGNGPFKQFEKGLTAEQYYKQIKNMPPEDREQILGSEPQDVHYMWGAPEDEGEGSAGSMDNPTLIAEQRLKFAVREAVNESIRRGWGTVSSEMIKKLKDSLKSFMPWKAVLKYFIRQTIKSDKKSSYVKVNRRFPWLFPGKKSNRIAKIAVAVDESGSVSNDFFTKFWSELNFLADIVEFTVIPFDHGVIQNKIFVWQKGQKVSCERVACGGTNFQAVVDWVDKDGGFDGLIIMTDMEASMPSHSRTQRLWVTDKRSYERCRWVNKCKDKIAVMM